MRFRTSALLILLVAAPSFGATAPAYRSYANARYAYSICYPPFMTAKPEAPNGDGRVFAGFDGGKLAVFGRNNPDGKSLADTARDDASDMAGRSGRITYRVQREHWAVFSGDSVDKLFYSKIFQRGDQFAIFELSYPRAAAARYKPVVDSMARCFRLIG